jgi:hypothetical protein
MKTTTKTLLTGLTAAAALIAGSANAASITIFDDDFQNTTAFLSGDSDADKQTDLNAGVATGTWTVTDGQESDLGTDGTNNGFVLERGAYDVTANFSQAGAVGTDATTIQFDLQTVRENGDKRTSFIGKQGTTSLFTVDVVGAGSKDVEVFHNGSALLQFDYNQGILSPGNLTNSALRTFTITMSATTYDLWIDIDGDDIVDIGEQVSSIAYSSTPTTGITSLQVLGATGSNTDAGVAIDNVLVTTVPEPGSLALLGLGGLLVASRRRRG